MTTMLFEHPIFHQHEVPPGHVERPARVAALSRRFAEPPFTDLPRGPVVPASREAILAVHEERYVDQIEEAVPEKGIASFDPDTFLSRRGLDAAYSAAGAVCAAVDAVFGPEIDNAFCAVRPPGHHATANRAMGFCIFNNVAVAARYAQREHGAGRVAIVDWDVHHGNGTQDIFWDDPSVMYCSTHQMPLFPYSGAASEVGVGNIVNVPLAEGANGKAFRAGFEEKILPALEGFRPELILVSAGFDAHYMDLLGGLALIADDFAWATHRLREIADRHSASRIVSTLEGGYDIEGLVESAAAHITSLMD